MLDVIRQAVLDADLIPIIADEYKLEDADVDIHHDAMYLLHACRLAIFELSEKSGAMMEIERAADYGTRSMVLYHDPAGSGWRVSKMINSYAEHHADRISLVPYLRADDAVKAVREWLQEAKVQGYATPTS